MGAPSYGNLDQGTEERMREGFEGLPFILWSCRLEGRDGGQDWFIVTLTAAFCSRFALPRERTLFFLEPRANVIVSL